MERFWKKVNKTEQCWQWQAARDPKGYGRFGAGREVGRKTLFAHRVAYELVCGSIPKGMCVLHTCDNPACVRPDHLFLGTQADNMADMKEKGRASQGSQRPNAKLDEGDVENIRANAMNLTQQEQANLYGVNQSQISRIISGKTWGREA